MLLQPGLFSQEVTLRGNVVDLNSGEQLIGVNIYLKDKMIGTITDNSGNFELKTGLSLPQVVIFSAVGYMAKEVTVYNETQALQVRLSEQIILGQEIVVSLALSIWICLSCKTPPRQIFMMVYIPSTMWIW